MGLARSWSISWIRALSRSRRGSTVGRGVGPRAMEDVPRTTSSMLKCRTGVKKGKNGKRGKNRGKLENRLDFVMIYEFYIFRYQTSIMKF